MLSSKSFDNARKLNGIACSGMVEVTMDNEIVSLAQIGKAYNERASVLTPEAISRDAPVTTRLNLPASISGAQRRT
jgi:hypothetical protein